MVPFGVIVALAGIVFGLFLMFVPETMIKIENKMEAWIPSQFVVDKLEKFYFGIDNIIFRYPLFFGFAGLMASLILIFLSIAILFG